MAFPHTVFSTALSPGRRSVRRRLRSLLEPGRPAVLPLAAVLTAILLGGVLVAWSPAPVREPADAPRSAQASEPLPLTYWESPYTLPAGTAPTLSDMTALLQQEFRSPRAGDSASLLYWDTRNGRTLGVARYESPEQPGARSSLILGVYDHGAGAFDGPLWELRGDRSYLGFDTQDGVCLLACSTVTETGSGQDCAVRLFSFGADGVLRPVTQLPQAALDSGVVPAGGENMLDPAAGADFWADRKALPWNLNLEIFRRNPAWSPDSPGDVPQWIHECLLPLSDRTEDHIPHLAQIRDYYSRLFALAGLDASDYPLYGHTPYASGVDDRLPDAQALSVSLTDGRDRHIDRLFLFEGDKLAGVRTDVSLSLMRTGAWGYHFADACAPSGDRLAPDWPDVTLPSGTALGMDVSLAVESFPTLIPSYDAAHSRVLLTEPFLGEYGCRFEIGLEGGSDLSYEQALDQPITSLAIYTPALPADLLSTS